jgi:3-phosphoshikimate 1-carboxyvinyltransferase
MASIRLIGPDHPIDAQLTIGGSKSISNRALIIRALIGSAFTIDNLSASDDTRILKTLLAQDQQTYDCGHAGTSFRFLTAYLSIKKGEQILTGSSRMLQRPIGPLVTALRHIGADIAYLGKDGYPPLKIGAFEGQTNAVVDIESGVSSQFISALCMLAPLLPKGLIIKLNGQQVSRAYVEMTLHMMAHFGIVYKSEEKEIVIGPQSYQPRDYIVESDWSSASYLLAIAAIRSHTKIALQHFTQNSIQGDAAVLSIARQLGVEVGIEGDTLVIQHRRQAINELSFNFINQPDLFQTIAVIAAVRQIKLQAEGLQTLKIKETDRIAALQTELSKINVSLQLMKGGEGRYTVSGVPQIDMPHFQDYGDHRMIMSLASIAAVSPVVLENPGVVSKSYPDFWKDLETMGFKIISL